jgi:general secretion pathway protein C
LKRLPLICTVLAVVALSASLAYWGLQLFQTKQRPMAPLVVAQAPEPNLDAGRGLFGGQSTVAVVSNYQLRGVVAATNGRGSVAIIAADGQPPQAYPVGKELAAGITVQDVQPRFVTLLEGGVQKRLELMTDEAGAAGAAGVQTAPPPPPPMQMAPQPLPMQPAPMPPPVQMAPAQPVNQNGVPNPKM